MKQMSSVSSRRRTERARRPQRERWTECEEQVVACAGGLPLGSPMCPPSSGEEALREVACEGGAWNWALVGPDPECLPLSAGGAGGIDEMRDAVGKSSHSFGLLRATFGIGEDATTKFIFIHASSDGNAVGRRFSARAFGQAMMTAPTMEAAILGFSPCSAKLRIRCEEECTIEELVEKLLTTARGGDAELISVQSYQATAACDGFDSERLLEEGEEGEDAAAQPEQEPDPEACSRSRTQAGTFSTEEDATSSEPMHPALCSAGGATSSRSCAGDDAVREAFRTRLDTTPAELALLEATKAALEEMETSRCGAKAMPETRPAPSAIPSAAPPGEVGLLRSRSRERPSIDLEVPEPVMGQLLMRMHGWFVTWWQPLRFQLSRGFLEWWPSEEEARSGAAPSGSMRLQGLQQQDGGASFKLRVGGKDGAIHSFQADSEEEAKSWVLAIWRHAGYCELVRECDEQLLASQVHASGGKSRISTGRR